MKKILIMLLVIYSVFTNVIANEDTLNLETKNKIEKIIGTLIYKVENKHNLEIQLKIYNKFNNKIINMGKGMSGKKLGVINYIRELMTSKISDLNKGNKKEILIKQGETKNFDEVLLIEYVDVELPEGKNGYAGIILRMTIHLDKKEFNLDLDFEKEYIIWQGYKITILNAKLYEPLKMNIEKMDINDILKDKLLNFNNHTDDEINNALLELNKQEEANTYWETLVDPDGSYHTYIESTYEVIGLKIYQYDGKVTNVEETLK